MIIGPSGNVEKKGEAGAYFGGDAQMKFVLPEELTRARNLGEFTLIKPKMADEVKQILWPFEMGIAGNPSSGSHKKVRSSLQKQIDAAVSEFLTKELKSVRELAEGELDDRFAAYDRAAAMIASFKSSAQAKDARKVELSLEADAKFKRELAAKKAYEKCEQSSADVKHKTTAMKRLARTFAGTQYGEKAKTAAEGAGG